MLQQHSSPWARSVAATLALALGLGVAACHGRGDSASLIAEARQYRQKGELNAAVIQLKNALQKDGANRLARQLLGEVYGEQGNAVSAEKELRRALALGGPALELTVLLGRTLLMQGQYQRVLDEIPPAAGERTIPALLALRANAQLGLSHSAEAGALFNEAMRLDPTFADALLGLARIALAERKPQAAATLVARALAAHPGDVDCLRFKGDLLRIEGKTEAALAAYRTILAAHPHHALAHVDVANLYIDRGKYAQARAELALARKASVGTLPIFYSQALLDFREGKYKTALESLQQILRAAPAHFPSILLLAAVESALGSNQSSEQHLRKFLAAYPQHLYASKLLGALYLRANNSDATFELLAPLLRSHPGDADLLTLAGEASMRARQFIRASQYFEKASALRPNAAMLHTALALSSLGNGETERAVAELERAASLDLTSARTGVLLVMSYLRANTPDKALAAVLAMEKQGDNPLLQNLKGGVYLAKQDLRSARASFEKARLLDPLYLPALDNLAQLDLLENHPEQAQQRYREALAKAPKNAGVMEALAKLAAGQGKQAEAISWMERACSDNPDALELALRLTDYYSQKGERQKALVRAQKVQASNPANPDALAMLAQVYAANENLNAAAESYGQLAALVPGSALPQLRLATLQLRMHDEAAAIASLKKALAIEPDLLDAQMTLLGVLIGQSRFAEAASLAASAQQRHPDSPAGYKLEGDLLSAQGKPVLALKAYERAFRLGNNGALLIQVHGALNGIGKPAEADARMALWFKDHPADVPTRLYYASSKLVKNDYKAAIEQLEAVLEHDPKNILALNDLAWTYQRINDKHALAYAERAYLLAPDSPAIMDTLGWICLEGGDLARALPLLQKATALAPNASEIRYHLALVLAKSGDKRNARRELERLLASKAEFSKRAEATAFLATL